MAADSRSFPKPTPFRARSLAPLVALLGTLGLGSTVACTANVEGDETTDETSESAFTASREVVFSPQTGTATHTAKIAGLIDRAQKTIDVAIYSFSDANISAALERATARGVKVRLVFETARDEKGLTGPALVASKSGQLEKRGVDVRYVNKIMHHKMMIIDGPRDRKTTARTAMLVTGSANWSNSAATKYDENTLFVAGEQELTLRFQREFNLMWDNSRDFASASFPFETSTLAIPDPITPDSADVDVKFTSANFDRNGTTFKSTDRNEVADELVRAIQGATKSIHVASGHLRSRPVAEAIMAKVESDPNLDVRLYLDGQEFISESGHREQLADLEDCRTKAAGDAAKLLDCNDKGFLFGFMVGQKGADVRYKYYMYRWNAQTAPQMHHKYMVIDGSTLYTGSYNLSDNAEHETFENMTMWKGAKYASLVAAYEANFESMWTTGEADGKLAALNARVANDATIPLSFEPMALTWQQIVDLKANIRSNCRSVDSDAFRRNPTLASCARTR
ncbi:MAG: phospholipase D-like domain-containing protein [Polyangiaceae bacterium]